MIRSPNLAASALALATAAGIALVKLPLAGGLFTGLPLAGAAAFLIVIRDDMITVAARNRRKAAPRAQRVVTMPPARREPIAEPVREPIAEPVPDVETEHSFRIPDAHGYPEFLRQPKTSHVFAKGDRVEFTVEDWNRGQTTIRGVIDHVYDPDLGYKVRTGQGPYILPVGAVAYVGDR